MSSHPYFVLNALEHACRCLHQRRLYQAERWVRDARSELDHNLRRAIP
jgi:hypothetical protein